MKLQADRIEGQNAIARHGPGGVLVNGVEHRSSVIVPWRGPVLAWPVASFADLTPSHFETLVALAPELVVFGSGTRIRFPQPAWRPWTRPPPAEPTTCCSPKAAAL